MKDLVLESVKAFPVWPDGATHILTTSIGWAGSETCKGEFRVVKKFHSDSSSFIGGYIISYENWQIACTKEQHIRKRIEMFKDAPEDAHSLGIEGNEINFYRYIEKNTYQLWCKHINDWVLRYEQPTDDVIIPRPTPEELDYIESVDYCKKWDESAPPTKPQWQNGLPRVGEWCERKFKDRDNLDIWLKRFVVGKDSIGKIVLEDLSHDFEIVEGGDFRPLKSEAEKEREELYAKAIAAIENDMLTYLGKPYDYRDAVEALIKADMIKRPTK